MGRECSTYGEKRNVFRISMGKLEERIPLGRHILGWIGNIRIYLREIGWGVMDWIDLTQDRDYLRALCEHGNEPSGSIKC
jgi:hypothetical protein